MQKIENNKGNIKDILCGNNRVKREVVVRNNKNAEERKNDIENLKVLSKEVLGSLRVNMTLRYKGFNEGCFPNTNQIRYLSDNLICHFYSDTLDYIDRRVI